MDKHSDAKRFLQELFPDHAKHAIFATEHNGIAKSWREFREVENLNNTRDCYLSTGVYPDDGVAKRKGRVQSVWALVIDDIGTTGPAAAAVEKALGEPTAEVLTSKNNAQWWYVLARRMPEADWRMFFKEVERLIGAGRLDGGEAGHVFRIPFGLNTKTERKGVPVPLDEQNFPVRLGRVNWGRRLDADAIMLFAEPVAKPEPSVSSGTGSDIKLGLDDLREFMSWIPNTFGHRQEWMDAIHDIKALCLEDEDGFTVLDEWSDPEKYPGYNRVVWDKAGASGLRSTGGWLKGLAEKLNPSGFAQMFAKRVFDDGMEHPPGPPGLKRAGITATPFKWRAPDKIPPRDWLYGDILIRKFISMTVAPGGVGKSSLIAVETLAQVTGRNLLGEKPAGGLRVWLWNLEDPGEETERKIHAAALHYGVSEADIAGRLFVDSGRDQKLVVAVTERNAPTIVRPVIAALVEQIRLRKIDIVVIDPFVSCHEVPENDNTAQDMVVKEWGRVAELGGCAVHLVDHTRKANGAEVTTESSRGGKAKTDAARVVRVINRLTDAQNRLWMVAAPWRYFSTFNDKANMAPPLDKQDWFYLESVGLGNGTTAAAAFAGGVSAGVVQGDHVGVVTRWTPPSAAVLVTGDNFKKMVTEMGADEWRMAPHAKEKWVGIPAARALNLDLAQLAQRKQVAAVLKQWFKAGLLKEVPQLDKHRKEKKIIKVTGGF